MNRVPDGGLRWGDDANVVGGAVVLRLWRTGAAVVVYGACARVGARWWMRLTILVSCDGLQNVGSGGGRALLRLVDLGLQAGDLALQGGYLVAQLVLPVLKAQYIVNNVKWARKE